MALERSLAGVRRRLAAVDAIEDRVEELARAVEELCATSEQRHAELTQRLDRLQDILQLVYDREPEFRERLRELRSREEYERPFLEESPLVSVVIPTYDRGELLVSRAIPSVLAQTHQNFEIVVIGDCAPEQTARLLAEIEEPRVRYLNLSFRGPYPSDPRDLWQVAGIPARNTGVGMARGSWIAPLDDDDAFHPRHIEVLLELARRDRCEVAYGQLRCLMGDGSEFLLGAFPPELGQFGWQGAIFHQGLRFFEMELADTLFSSPADWSLCRRMLRAGVHFGMLAEPVTDHYESRFSIDLGAA
jgi:glycosyltransferase involved in cell wall biosynthesis